IRLHVALCGFTYVHHADYLALTRLWLSGGSFSRDLDPDWCMTSLRYIVRLATLFRVLGSSGDTDGSHIKR
uniref:hypothetical protein n=2 Tax=Vibrio anguillarum TaxID=55601 RepID=UPI001BE104D4